MDLETISFVSQAVGKGILISESFCLLAGICEGFGSYVLMDGYQTNVSMRKRFSRAWAVLTQVDLKDAYTFLNGKNVEQFSEKYPVFAD